MLHYQHVLHIDNKYALTPINSSDVLEFKFLHDRVQQGSYSLIYEQQKREVHLQIARLLLKNTSSDQIENKIFDITERS